MWHGSVIAIHVNHLAVNLVTHITKLTYTITQQLA